MTIQNSQNPEERASAIITQKFMGTPIGPGLHVVSTPIGNLGDITLRALATLNQSHLIICEDTRVTRKLTSHYSINTRLLSYHDHSKPDVLLSIIEILKSGKIVSLVSDAGTPTVSDPGYKLINAAIEAEIAVTTVPGVSAVVSALSVSGLPTDKFLFFGFLPPRTASRIRALKRLTDLAASLVFYESPRRFSACLSDMSQVLGPREAVVARELTKRHEEIQRGDLTQLALEAAKVKPPKGELVILLGPPTVSTRMDINSVKELLSSALKTESLRDAATSVASQTGHARRDLYSLALSLKDSQKR